jgi:hypothetical protein
MADQNRGTEGSVVKWEKREDETLRRKTKVYGIKRKLFDHHHVACAVAAGESPCVMSHSAIATTNNGAGTSIEHPITMLTGVYVLSNPTTPTPSVGVLVSTPAPPPLVLVCW